MEVMRGVPKRGGIKDLYPHPKRPEHAQFAQDVLLDDVTPADVTARGFPIHGPTGLEVAGSIPCRSVVMLRL